MNPFAYLLVTLACLGYVAVGGVLAWFAADMRFILKGMQRKNQLTIEGRWTELEEHLKQVPKTRRPFVWIYQRFLLPGNNAAQLALFLLQQGRLEEALTKADEAIRQVEKKFALLRPIYRHAAQTTHCGALAARVLILTSLGRYEEGRQAAALLQQASGSNVRANSSLALLEAKCGRLDEALALAKTVPPSDPQYDSMQGLIAQAYGLKGEFAQAIEALNYEPGGVSKFYRADGLRIMNQSAEGSRLVELHSRKLAGIFPPARWIKLAGVYLAQDAFDKAESALDEAEKTLGSNRVLQAAFWRGRARCHAAQGRPAQTEEAITHARTFTEQVEHRSSMMETHLAAGRAYLSLRRFDQALAELAEAERFSLHPMEKHQVAYWTARTHEAAGNLAQSIPYFRKVASDPIPTWMRRQAEAIVRGWN